MLLMNRHQEDQLVNQFGDLNLYQVGRKRLPEFSKFVFNIYKKHYWKKYQWMPSANELLEMQQSDAIQFKNSVYFGFKNANQELLGTIKATQKIGNLRFPIESEFGIDLKQICKKIGEPVDEIWHLGRLAIHSERLLNQEKNLSSKQLFRLLLHYSLTCTNKSIGNLVIAESDVLIYQLFKDIGIPMKIVGAVKNCLGSPTYPVVMTGKVIRDWLEANPVEKIINQEVYACAGN